MAAPLVEQIAANLLAGMQGINGNSPYANTLTVIRPPMEPPSPADKLVLLLQGKAEALPAPWGIRSRRLWFSFVFYARPSEKAAGAVDIYLNSIEADLEKAIMADPRRGGLVDVDTIVHDAQFFDSNKPGLIVGIMPVSVVSRTLASDPSFKAPLAANEAFFQGGAVLHYARYLNYNGPGTPLGPWRRWTDLKITPVIAVKTDAARTDRDGLLRPADVQVIAWAQKYELETQDFSPQALALQMGATGVAGFSQAATPLVSVPLLSAGPDAVIPLNDAGGNALWNVQSIQSVTSADSSITYVPGTDYIADPRSLQEGILQIPPGSSIPPAVNILVSMTPAAISGQRLVMSQQSSNVRYRARIVWPAANIGGVLQQMQVHGPIDIAILPKTSSRDETAYSASKFDLVVLDDDSDTPAGNMIFPIGAMPVSGD